MRVLSLFVLVTLAACATAPAPAPTPAAPPPAPKVEVDPLVLESLEVRSQTLLEATFELKGTVAKLDGGHVMAWRVTSKGGNELASGTSDLVHDDKGAFTLPLKVVYGTDAASLAQYQGADTQDVVIEAKYGEGDAAIVRSKAARVRSPKLPKAEIHHVQASRTGAQELGITFLFNLSNPNTFTLNVGTLHYVAMLDGKTVASGDLPLGAKVPASGENLFEIPAEASPQTCGKDIVAMLKKTELPWTFTGSIKIGGVEIPLDFKGMTKVSQ